MPMLDAQLYSGHLVSKRAIALSYNAKENVHCSLYLAVDSFCVQLCELLHRLIIIVATIVWHPKLLCNANCLTVVFIVCADVAM